MLARYQGRPAYELFVKAKITSQGINGLDEKTQKPVFSWNTESIILWQEWPAIPGQNSRLSNRHIAETITSRRPRSGYSRFSWNRNNRKSLSSNYLMSFCSLLGTLAITTYYYSYEPGIR